MEIKDNCRIPMAQNTDLDICARGRKNCLGKSCPDYAGPVGPKMESDRKAKIFQLKKQIAVLQRELDALEPVVEAKPEPVEVPEVDEEAPKEGKKRGRR